jgi:hypothetical protein
MDKKYTIITNQFGKEIITYEEDSVLYSFPPDLGNSDYQEYLKHEAAAK